MIANCERHHKQIKFMCLFRGCEQKSASICEDCLTSTHKHEAQDMAQVSTVQSFFANSSADQINFINQARLNFTNHFEAYRTELSRALDLQLRTLQRKVCDLFFNIDVYNVVPNASPLRKTLFDFRVCAFQRISPREFQDFYTDFKAGAFMPSTDLTLVETETILIAEVKQLFEGVNNSFCNLLQDRQVLKFDPQAGAACSVLGQGFKNYLNQEAANLSKAKQEKKWQHAVRRLMKQANQLEKEGRRKEAIDKYGQIIEMNPNYYKAHNNKGVNLKSLGKIDEAIRAFQKSVVANPQWVTGYVNLGNCYRQNLMNQDAIREYDRAIELEPKCLNAHYNKAVSLVNLQRFKEAQEEVVKSKMLSPADQDVLLLEGICLAGLGKLQEAIKSYDKIIANNPSCDQGFYNRGIAYQRLFRFGQAQLSFEQALSLCPNDQEYKAKLEAARRELRIQAALK